MGSDLIGIVRAKVTEFSILVAGNSSSCSTKTLESFLTSPFAHFLHPVSQQILPAVPSNHLPVLTIPTSTALVLAIIMPGSSWWPPYLSPFFHTPLPVMSCQFSSQSGPLKICLIICYSCFKPLKLILSLSEERLKFFGWPTELYTIWSPTSLTLYPTCLPCAYSAFSCLGGLTVFLNHVEHVPVSKHLICCFLCQEYCSPRYLLGLLPQVSAQISPY